MNWYSPEFLLVAASIISGGVLLVLVFFWPNKSTELDRSSAPSSGLLAEDVRELLDHMSRELDTRMDALRELIQQADQVLQRSADSAGKTVGQPPTPKDPQRPVASPNAPERPLVASDLGEHGPTQSTPQNHPAAAETLQSPTPRNPRVSRRNHQSPPRQSSRGSWEAPSAQDQVDPERFAHVYWLADEGLTASQIATRTGMHRGEIELVLALRNRQSDSVNAPAKAG